MSFEWQIGHSPSVNSIFFTMSFLFLYSPKVSVIFDISFSNSFFWVASFVSYSSMFDFSLIISKQGPHFSTIVDFSPFSLPNLAISFLAACHT